ncbi:MAG: hypothetical protein JSS09_06335 [Verrucomicrobia bacterium]|nr:hypothetical protein [Verrucomicrobiota bacterium]
MHTYKNLNIQEMIIPFYPKGDLKRLKKKDLSLEEKISLGADLMRILNEIHALNIIHDDVHLGNLILEENLDPSSDIKYNLVLIDWEKSRFIKDEYYLKNKDLYFAGVSLYFLLHPENYNRSYYKKVDLFMDFFKNPKNDCSDELILGEISQEISKRRKDLSKKKSKNMTLEEKFEYAILQIMNPTCKTIEDAAYWQNIFQNLLLKKTYK